MAFGTTTTSGYLSCLYILHILRHARADAQICIACCLCHHHRDYSNCC